MLDGRHAAATRGELGHGMGDGPTAFPYWLWPVRSTLARRGWPARGPARRENRRLLHDGNAQKRGASGGVGARHRHREKRGEEIDKWGPHVRFEFS